MVFQLILFSLLTAFQANPDSGNWAIQIEKAAVLDDVKSLKKIIQLIDRSELSANPKLTYWKALATFRIAMITPEDEREPLMDTGIELMERYTKKQPGDADGWALLSTFYGNKIPFNPMFNGMRYGGKSNDAMDKALALDPENARTLMFRGVSEIFKPAFFGGGLEKAMSTMKKAVKNFESEPDHPNKWGYAESLIWMGYIYQELDQPDQARVWYRKALAIYPDYKWVKNQLLPNLK